MALERIGALGKSVSEIKQRKWFRVKELTPGEMAFLLKIFEGK